MKVEGEQLQDKLFKTYSVEMGIKRVNEPDMKGSGQVLGISTAIPLAYVTDDNDRKLVYSVNSRNLNLKNKDSI